MNIRLIIKEKLLSAVLEDNSSTKALVEILSKGNLTLLMQDYGNMEKVGSLGLDLPRNDKMYTTKPGDIILYQGNLLVIYYEPNTWSFTKIGTILNIEKSELKTLLNGEEIKVTLTKEGNLMVLNEKYILNNGVEIPKLGLGTWMIPNEKAEKLVVDAIKIGYRHIDTAQAYQNEEGIGRGIRSCGVNREDLFITTKLAAEVKDYKSAVESINDSLRALGVDYIDLMLIHSPQPWIEYGEVDRFFEGNKEAWKALEDAYKLGKLRAIGVSNFQKVDLDNILDSCTVKPMVNQLLVHASNTPFDLIEYSKSNGLLVEAYSPIAHGEALKNPLLAELAEKYNVSVPQLCIRYDLQLGTLPLPKTSNPTHLKNNSELDFQINDEDMLKLKNMERIKDYGESSFFPVYGGKLK